MVKLTVDQAKANTEILILPNKVQPTPMLIGQAFTELPNVAVFKQKDYIRLFHERENAENEDDNGQLTSLEVPKLPRRCVSL